MYIDWPIVCWIGPAPACASFSGGCHRDMTHWKLGGSYAEAGVTCSNLLGLPVIILQVSIFTDKDREFQSAMCRAGSNILGVASKTVYQGFPMLVL